MAKVLETGSNGLDWKVNVPGGSSETLLVDPGVTKKIYVQVRRLILKCFILIGRFLEKARSIAADEPKKVIHGVKVGLALSLVSLFYYMRPLYDGVGGNAMWAVMTVVVALEYSVGATIAKSFNRICATFLAGSIGVGVHYLANQCGEELEPLILQVSVLILAAAATFSRFIPSVKARFDYGAMIFILTFSFVSVSGYRVDKLLELARNRVSTIAIGTSICILTSMLFYPVWAGIELHNQIYKNLEKLADSLDGCVTVYFKENEDKLGKKQEGYKSVLNSKASEEAMANLARWEPAHGRFKFQHPWKQYLKVGASIRRCAYCIETLSGFINSEDQAPELVKNHLKEVCMTLSLCSSNVLKELATSMRTMTKLTKSKIYIQEMKAAVRNFQKQFRELSKQAILLVEHEKNSRICEGEMVRNTHMVEIFPMATMASLLIEIAERVQNILGEVAEVAAQSDFEIVNKERSKGNGPSKPDQGHTISMTSV
ncbi:aluminum-activated malate transporter 10 [Rutidosis leptorrhynchoides]|uniref:aluminum-activated malate transporter 10 n=1 Tax=Rutidosis leptorrhynchoides TaxID=125765 RepID=UPI003A99C33A